MKRRITILLVFTLLGVLITAFIATFSISKAIVQQEIVDSTGSNRLALIDRERLSILGWLQSSRSFDFDSLVWRRNAGDSWYDYIVISQSAFQAGSPRRRWVSQIESLDGTKGTAIIKVAEGDVPEGSPSIQYVYSWREWGLKTNSEVRRVRTCADPFEKY